MAKLFHRRPASVIERGCATTPVSEASADRASAVRLIDRRTGQTHRINGSPLVILTRRPDVAAAELLEGRDPAVWEARIDPIGPRGRA